MFISVMLRPDLVRKQITEMMFLLMKFWTLAPILYVASRVPKPRRKATIIPRLRYSYLSIVLNLGMFGFYHNPLSIHQRCFLIVTINAHSSLR